MNIYNNIMLLTDSYKLSHYVQYPPGTETVYSYFESRDGAEYPRTTFFGLQYLLKRYLEGVVVTEDKIQAAGKLANSHFGKDLFNWDGWRHILENHGGRLPVKIRAVEEGTSVPTGNVLMTVENTDPLCFWLPNYLETLLVQVWYPSTVATISKHLHKIIRSGLEETGTIPDLPFKLHDFGFRGASSVESCGIGGLAHLVSFAGTDNIPALLCGQEFYGADMAGFSIPASEHSTITSWGEGGEVDAFRNMLQKYPTGLVACVSDSYDIGRACSDLWGTKLKDEVLGRDGTLVVRPDSGEIVSTVLEVLDRLAKSFGCGLNDKGFKVLNDKVRVIQGDGCTPETIQKLISAMIVNGWSVDNVAFGMGGGLLQRLNRDTQRFAFKCSAIKRGGNWQDVYKRPATDPSKNSKRGRMSLSVTADGEFRTTAQCDHGDLLEPVFIDGRLVRESRFNDIITKSFGY
jgi:nicotinamide phosphoribosyltransferase